MYDDYEHLRFAQSGKILTVTLDHPPMNAVNRKLHGELARVFWQINRDSSVAVVVVTGAGDRAFSAGGDLNAMKKRLDEGEHASWTNTIWEAREILQSVLGLEKPLIARINGHAMGLGATLAVLADFSYMVRTAKIADSHVKVGLSPGDGGALLWPILMGFAKARLALFQECVDRLPVVIGEIGVGFLRKTLGHHRPNQVHQNGVYRNFGAVNRPVRTPRQQVRH